MRFTTSVRNCPSVGFALWLANLSQRLRLRRAHNLVEQSWVVYFTPLMQHPYPTPNCHEQLSCQLIYSRFTTKFYCFNEKSEITKKYIDLWTYPLCQLWRNRKSNAHSMRVAHTHFRQIWVENHFKWSKLGWRSARTSQCRMWIVVVPSCSANIFSRNHYGDFSLCARGCIMMARSWRNLCETSHEMPPLFHITHFVIQ